MSAELVSRDRAVRKAHVGPTARPRSRRMSALRMHGHSLLMHGLPLTLPHRSLRPDRLNPRPDLRPGWTMLCGTMSRTISCAMVWSCAMIWLLGVRRKGKRQRNQWKDDPRSAGSVHCCKPPPDVAVMPIALAYFLSPFSRQFATRTT
jgi:hypothetical protein